MKKSEIIFLVTFIIATCDGVLTGFEQQDITVHRKFGCVWQGGISSRVTCQCNEEAEVKKLV